MHFENVLHPEIVLGLRGESWQKEIYRKYVLSNVSYEEENKRFTVKTRPGFLQSSSTIDRQNVEEFILTTSLMTRMMTERPKIFHVGKDFLKALSTIKKDIPTNIIKDRFFAYFSFPKNTVFFEKIEIQGGYVLVEADKNDGFGRTVTIQYYVKEAYNQAAAEYYATTHAHGMLNTELMSTNANLLRANAREHMPAETFSDNGNSTQIYQTLINLSVYCHSQDPDIQKLRPELNLPKSKKKAARAAGEQLTNCMLPVSLLSWNYKRPVQYSKDSCFVESHMRWQPCGPARSEVKLIWVTEHERHYKNVVTQEVQPEPART